MTWKMRTDNPATSFRKRPEIARERFLSFTNCLSKSRDMTRSPRTLKQRILALTKLRRW
nr:hypothetical protein [Tabrizicola sp.]